MGERGVCVYYGSTEDVMIDHIIPVSRAGVVDPVLEDSWSRLIIASGPAKNATAARATETYSNGTERTEGDEIPKLTLSKFLKLSYKLHETQGTLDLRDPNMDGVLDIYDLGVVITHLIHKLSSRGGRENSYIV